MKAAINLRRNDKKTVTIEQQLWRGEGKKELNFRAVSKLLRIKFEE